MQRRDTKWPVHILGDESIDRNRTKAVNAERHKAAEGWTQWWKLVDILLAHQRVSSFQLKVGPIVAQIFIIAPAM